MSVFGALNRFISHLDSDSSFPSGRAKLAPAGFQVLRNTDPELPIEPWYDFIIGINGRSIDSVDPALFATEVRNCAGSSVAFTLWSAKGQQLRDLNVPIVPSSPIGVTAQWAPLSITEDVWHILEVIPNSPADVAGLVPYGDYVVGTPEGTVRGESGLGEIVEDYLSRPLRLYVYNHEYDVTRLVTITPSRSWGGEGALGCVLGFGALHRLPVPLTEPPTAPGEMLFETAQLAKEDHLESTPTTQHQLPQHREMPGKAGSPKLLVPALMPLEPSIEGTPSSKSERSNRKKKGAVSPNAAFDEAWKESEARSKEEEGLQSRLRPAALPPPPQKKSEVTEPSTPLLSGGEPRQTRSPAPVLDDDDE